MQLNALAGRGPPAVFRGVPAHVAPFAEMVVSIAQALDEVVGAYRSGTGVPYPRYGAAFRRSQAALNVRCGLPGWQVALPRC